MENRRTEFRSRTRSIIPWQFLRRRLGPGNLLIDGKRKLWFGQWERIYETGLRSTCCGTPSGCFSSIGINITNLVAGNECIDEG